jgi:hypothetical protein
MPTQVHNNNPYVYQYPPSTPRVQVQNDQRAQAGQQAQDQQQQNVEQQKFLDNRQAQNQQRVATQYKGNVIDLTA